MATGRVHLRPGGHPDRRPQRRRRRRPSGTASSSRCWASSTCWWPSTRWTWWTTAQEVFEEIRADYKEFAARLDIPDLHFIPDRRPARRQRRRSQPAHALVPGQHADELPGYRLHRLGPQPGGLPLPGAVRQPPAPGLPRLLRHRRLGHRPPGRRGAWSCRRARPAASSRS